MMLHKLEPTPLLLSLVDYMLSTGDFHDPESRIPFKDSDLEEIDNVIKKAGLTRPSVLAAKRNPYAFSELQFRRDALLGLERCAGETVTDILRIIETCDPEEAQMRLALHEFPSLADLYRQVIFLGSRFETLLTPLNVTFVFFLVCVHTKSTCVFYLFVYLL